MPDAWDVNPAALCIAGFHMSPPLCLQYTDKEEVVLWMNTVGPYHNRQETYKYFSLPFCAGSKKTISHYHETLGEALQGVELEFSGLDIKFKGDLLTAWHSSLWGCSYATPDFLTPFYFVF